MTTKQELVTELAERMDVSKTKAGQFLDCLADIAHEHISKGREFALNRIGVLTRQQRAARTGRNPITGAPIQIPARAGVKFRAYKPLLDRLK